MNDRIWPSMLILVGIVLLVLYILFGVVLHIKAPGEIARIEQLRRDVQKVSAAESEDVIGQVTQWNQNIVQYQVYNRVWVISWLVPDQWDAVALIEIPER
jgi:hypothetical protein